MATNLAYANTAVALNNKITHMIKSNLPDATVGVIVQNAATGKILYNYHGSKHFFCLLSTTKVIYRGCTKSVPESYFQGPDYRYEATALYYVPTTMCAIMDHIMVI